MGFQMSPGVEVKEYDLTGFIPAVATTGAAYVGHFNWGPVLDFTVLQNKKQLEKWFGKPSDVNYRDWFTCSNFLDYSNNLNVVRVVDETVALNSTVDGSGLLIKNETHHSQIINTPDGDTAQFAARCPGDIGNSIEIMLIDAATWGYNSYTNNYEQLFDGPPGTSDYVAGINGKNDELHVVIIDKDGLFTGVPGAVLEKFEFLSKARDAVKLDGEPSFYGTYLNKHSQYVWFLENPEDGVGVYADAGEIISAKVTDNGYGYENTPVVSVAGIGTNGDVDAVLADTGAVKYITITDGGTGYDTADIGLEVAITGDGKGAEAIVSAVNTGIVSVTVTNGGSGYVAGETLTVTDTGSGTGAVVVVDTVDGSGAITSVLVNAQGSGYSLTSTTISGGSGTGATFDIETGVITEVTVTAGGTGYTSASTDFSAIANSGGRVATATATIGYAIASFVVTTGGSGYDDTTTIVVADPEALPAGTATTVPLRTGAGTVKLSPGPTGYADNWNTYANGTEYKSLAQPWIKKLAGGVNSFTVDENELLRGWDMFKNAEVVDVSLLILGDAGEDASGDTHKTVVKYVIDNIAENRKDCVAFFSPRHSDVVGVDEVKALENVIATRENINSVSSYAFMDSGWKYQYDVFNDKYRWIPLNADMAGLCAATDLARDPWWSPAGFTRGQIKNVIKLAFNPNKGARDELYKRSINPCVSFKGEGVLLYGDRTQQTKPSAFQKLNIRRLFIVLEKAIAKAAKYQLFEFNDKFTRQNFVSQVEPYLRMVQGRRGIQDFLVVCDERNNTPEVIDRSEFVADIYIKPAYSINFITLNFVAVRTGVEFNEVVGVTGGNF